MDYPSKLIEEAVTQVAKLPGIGKKTALRLVLHLIKEKVENTYALTEALQNLRSKIRFCNTCQNISDTEICSICASHKRDRSILCVVEDVKDVMAIENTHSTIHTNTYKHTRAHTAQFTQIHTNTHMCTHTWHNLHKYITHTIMGAKTMV